MHAHSFVSLSTQHSTLCYVVFRSQYFVFYGWQLYGWSRQTNMAANNYYGFPHAGAQYGYKLIFVLRMLYTDINSCSVCCRFSTRMLMLILSNWSTGRTDERSRLHQGNYYSNSMNTLVKLALNKQQWNALH